MAEAAAAVALAAATEPQPLQRAAAAPQAAPPPRPEAAAAAARDAAAGFRETVAQRRPFRRGGRQGAGGDAEAGRGRRRRGRSQPKPEMAEVFTTLGRVAEYYATDARRAIEAQTALSTKFFELWGSTLKKLGGETTPDVAAPEPGDKRFADPGMARQSLFRLHQTGLCADLALGRRSRAPRRRTRSAHAREGGLLHEAGDERAVALQLPRHQPRAAAHDARRERREPGARHEDDGRGHRGRPRPVAHPPGRRGQVQARRQPRGDAGQGGVSQRVDGVDPVRAVDADGLQAAAADRAAVDQQVLRARSQPGKDPSSAGRWRRG